MNWERLAVPHGVSVWRDPGDGRIVAAAHVWGDGFEWCQAGPSQVVPREPRALAALPGREYFPLFDDEKTEIVGPLATARAFLRAVVTSGLVAPTALRSFSWPSGEVQDLDTWPPLDLGARAALAGSSDEPQVPWDSPTLFPTKEPPRIAKYRRLQSWYRENVLHAKAGAWGQYAALGSYLDKDEVKANPGLNFLSDEALSHAKERAAVVKQQGGSLDPVRLYRNMLSSMPMCFNLFGTMRGRQEFLLVFQKLFDPRATSITEIVCEWAPQPPADFLDDRTAFDAIIFYATADGPRFCGIETKYTEPFSETEYKSARYDAVTRECGWFADPERAMRELKGSKTNQLWRTVLLAAAVEMDGEHGQGAVAVVALSDDPGAQTATAAVGAALIGRTRLLSVPIETILARAADQEPLAGWATNFKRRYVG